MLSCFLIPVSRPSHLMASDFSLMTVCSYIHEAMEVIHKHSAVSLTKEWQCLPL